MESKCKIIKLDYQKSYHFVRYLIDRNDWQYEINKSKSKSLIIKDHFNQIIEFTLPIIFPEIYQNEPLSDYLNKINLVPSNYFIILIQAGNCALGHFCNNRLMDHKVIKKYMVRKKQGKAQITYLKKKGKSRLGSRIRLANTTRFFIEINEVLSKWFTKSEVFKIFYSCTPYLWGLLFRVKVKTPFNKKDARIKKIPIDVKIPNFKELIYINKFILSGRLQIYDEKYADIVYRI